MNVVYGYNNNIGSIKNFKCLRSVCIWAGCIGVVQALAWIALTLTGILAYNCVITVEGTFNYASVIPTLFLSLYFQGSCPLGNTPAYADFITVKTILTSKDILIWNSVYLAVAICWVISSGLIVTYVKNDNRKQTLGVILTWVIVTFFICAMDLSLGVIFGIDYGRFDEAAARYNLSSAYQGNIDAQAAQLLAAMVISMSLMIISFKGFIFWIVNVALMVYLIIQVILILTENESRENLFMTCKETDDILATRPPINAYQEERKPEIISTVFANDAYIHDNETAENTVSINQDLISRAARMSMDASLQERRFRNLDNFQQYPPRQRPESSIPEASPVANSPIVVAAFPVPDYTPPMQRAAQNRNQRYQ